MRCPLCGSRKARRACPATNQTICTVCCGTKRQTAIACPSDCVYLAAAREHPAAVVRRQQERDLLLLLPALEGLTERQRELLFLFQSLVVRHTPDGFARLLDDDVAEAAAVVAATLETAARGVIYEHTTQSPPARRLADELKRLLAELRERAKISDREAAGVLRAMERGARETRARSDGSETAYLSLLARLLPPARADAAAPADAARSLILP